MRLGAEAGRAGTQEQDLNEDQAKYYGERDGGNYGWSTKQWQMKTYQAKKEAEAKRVALFETALGKFKKGDIEGVRPGRQSCHIAFSTRKQLTL